VKSINQKAIQSVIKKDDVYKSKAVKS